MRKLFVLALLLLLPIDALAQTPPTKLLPGWITSDQLRHIITNPTGTGSLVFARNPAVTVIATGSTAARSLQERFGQVFNVLDFGAHCDGTTDDTTAINAAVSAATSNGGGTVVFPSGKTCVHTGTISITSNGVWLAGSGSGQYESTLLFNNGSSDSIKIGFQGSPIYGNGIRDLLINHGAKTGGNALSLNNLSAFRMVNSIMSGAWNGALVQRTNNVEFDFVTIVRLRPAWQPYGVKWFSPANNAQRRTY